MRKELDPWNSQDRESSQWMSSRFRKIPSLKKINQKVIEENASSHLYTCVYTCAHSYKQVYMYNTHKNILVYKITSSGFFEIECSDTVLNLTV